MQVNFDSVLMVPSLFALISVLISNHHIPVAGVEIGLELVENHY